MLDIYFKYPGVIARIRRGALGNEIDRVAADLSRSGYQPASARNILSRIACFSAYAAKRGCSKTRQIPYVVVERYLGARQTTAARLGARQAIDHVIRCCPERFASATSQKNHDSYGVLISAYLQHLSLIHGLSVKTCEGRVLAARRMLAWHDKHRPGRPLSELTAKHVLVMTHDLLAECRSDGTKSYTTGCIRSFLRYLHWADLNDQQLARFVPKVPSWRRARLPPRLAWDDVRRAIDAIETTTPLGIRDRAIMLLLATTGIRAKELRQLEIGDIHWRTGKLMLRHTKGHRDRVVPLLDETGAALAEYLLRARPPSTDCAVFLTHIAPVRPFSNSDTVSRIVQTRLQRAEIPIQRGGAHLLRHSFATRLVEQRLPIKDVADLLGHRSIDTTSIYVKVAIPQLADVALPLPGSVI